jgi:hypothetical protein
MRKLASMDNTTWEMESKEELAITSRFPGSGETVLLCWSFEVGVPVAGVSSREEGEGGGRAGRRASSGRDSVCVCLCVCVCVCVCVSECVGVGGGPL